MGRSGQEYFLAHVAALAGARVCAGHPHLSSAVILAVQGGLLPKTADRTGAS